MPVGPIEPFELDNEPDADAYLKDLLEKPEYRSVDEVRLRAQKYIKDERLKNRFINRASEALKS